jgi:hypothetical protein
LTKKRGSGTIRVCTRQNPSLNPTTDVRQVRIQES